MERMAKKDAEAGITSTPLTDAQKAAIAETRNFYEAKLAELEVLHQSKMNGTFEPGRTRDARTAVSPRARASHDRARQQDRAAARVRKRQSGARASRERRIGCVRRRSVIAGALVLCVAAAALAQRRFGDGGFDEYPSTPAIHNVPYDGQFTFVRVKYDTAPGGYWAGGRPSWVHGYPLAEQT